MGAIGRPDRDLMAVSGHRSRRCEGQVGRGDGVTEEGAVLEVERNDPTVPCVRDEAHGMLNGLSGPTGRTAVASGPSKAPTRRKSSAQAVRAGAMRSIHVGKRVLVAKRFTGSPPR